LESNEWRAVELPLGSGIFKPVKDHGEGGLVGGKGDPAWSSNAIDGVEELQYLPQTPKHGTSF